MGKLRGGTAYVKLDGEQVDVRGDLKWSSGDVSRETIKGMDRIHGYKEMIEAPFVEMAVSDAGDLDTKKFQKATDITVTVELGSGKQFVLRNAWHVPQIEVDGVEGQMTLRFEGLSGEELPTHG